MAGTNARTHTLPIRLDNDVMRSGICKPRAMLVKKSIACLLLGFALASPASAVTLVAVDRGWYRADGLHQPTNTNFAAGRYYADPMDLTVLSDYRNFFVFDLSSVSGTVTSATLTLFLPASSYLSSDATETYQLHDVSTSIASLVAGTGGTPAFNDLGGGSAFGSVTVDAAAQGTPINIALNAAGLAYLGAALGGQVALGGAVTTLSGQSLQAIFGATLNAPTNWSVLSIETAIVPVPAALWMLGGGLAALGFLRRR
jgi:hypothetical protein